MNAEDKKREAINREWEHRAKVLESAIRQAFLCHLMDEETLNRIIGELSPPKNGFLSGIVTFFDDSFEWHDDELLEFVKILADHNWSQIDWNEHWQVVPLFTEPVLTYCLPGLMIAIATDAFGHSNITAETLLGFFLYPAVVNADKARFDASRFSPEQLRCVIEYVRGLRDLMFFDNPSAQTITDEI